MRRIEKITGRSDDMIILRGVNLFPTQIEELILRVPALSPHFQCQLDRPGRMDRLTVRVEHRSDTNLIDWRDGGTALAKLIKNQIGVTVGVEVLAPGGIERSVGKMRRIVDNRPKGLTSGVTERSVRPWGILLPCQPLPHRWVAQLPRLRDRRAGVGRPGTAARSCSV